ncbi:MAG: hypothetical protein OXU77_17165 [Gammaproteobacteria bacterium]|nr:hypothetical protein [Gammaproteobacteria bacterium]MDE0443016.1 hypothetical protein [Gammaproteobacteria bacterium]
MTATEHRQPRSRIIAAGRSPRTVALGSLRRASLGVVLLAGLGLSAEQEPPTARGVEPERLDVVFSRLARQQRTLDALLEIVLKLEKVAGHPDAAAALLSHEGEPTDGLRSALVEVAKRRSPSVDASPGAGAEPAGTRPTQSLRPEIVYAQLAPGNPPRVLLTARGVLFEAAAGQTIRLGEDTIHVRGVRRAQDAGVDVELSVNGEAPFVGRAGR